MSDASAPRYPCQNCGGYKPASAFPETRPKGKPRQCITCNEKAASRRRAQQ